MHAITKLLEKEKIARGKYSLERNKLVSDGIKKAYEQNPNIILNRIEKHRGSKRSKDSCKKMQEAAWKRMAAQSSRYVSNAEILFGDFLEKKLGLNLVRQVRFGLKPFDFFVENRVLVEFDGPYHYDKNYYLYRSGEIKFKKQEERDEKRNQIAKKMGLKLVVVQQKDVDNKMRLKGDAMHKFMSDLGYEVI